MWKIVDCNHNRRKIIKAFSISTNILKILFTKLTRKSQLIKLYSMSSVPGLKNAYTLIKYQVTSMPLRGKNNLVITHLQQ